MRELKLTPGRMRQAIRGDNMRKRRQLLARNPRCPILNIPLTWKNAEMHHVIPFSALRREFKGETLREWRKFHKQRAVFQLVSKEAHATMH